jgi:hypothetical protein
MACVLDEGGVDGDGGELVFAGDGAMAFEVGHSGVGTVQRKINQAGKLGNGQISHAARMAGSGEDGKEEGRGRTSNVER